MTETDKAGEQVAHKIQMVLQAFNAVTINNSDRSL